MGPKLARLSVAVVVIMLLETKKTKDLLFWCSVPAMCKQQGQDRQAELAGLSIICLAAGKQKLADCLVQSLLPVKH